MGICISSSDSKGLCPIFLRTIPSFFVVIVTSLYLTNTLKVSLNSEMYLLIYFFKEGVLRSSS